MIKKFCKKYKLPENTLHELLSHMAEVRFSKGELIISEGERNSNFYLLKKGIWRAYYLTDGTENSLWFAAPGDTAFSSWGYVDGEVSPVNIESVNESIAYCISKPELDGTPPTAKERYMTLMEENPELLQDVPLKYLASYLYITPQSLSRIRAGLKKK